MTLTADGHLGIGTTSPATDARLNVVGGYARVENTVNTTISGSYVWNSTDRGMILFNRSNTANTAVGLTMFGGTSANSVGAIYMVQEVGNSAGALAFYTGGDSKGSPYAYERARIDSSGNLLVGTTSATNKLYVKSTATNVVNTYLDNASASPYGLQIQYTAAAPNNTSNEFIYCADTGNNRFIVYATGNVANRNNSYGGISDVKLKENIVDATPKLAGLMQVKVRNYNLIGETQKQIGVVAQELEQVFPSMVDESPDRDAEGNNLGTTTKQVKYSVFVPMLIKAIQEQQALITALTARLDAANL
jgi:hypothetical protein